MIKTIQKGRNINSVYSLAGRLVLKEYINGERLTRELDGLKNWRETEARKFIPKNFFRIGRFVFFKAINESDERLSFKKRAVRLRGIIRILAKVWNSFDSPGQPLADFFYQNWIDYLGGLFLVYLRMKKRLEKHLSLEEVGSLERAIRELLLINWTNFKIVPLHRDLHWGNVLLTNEGGIKIIDFEHFCFGPPEYEFCNSLFWDDKCSLGFNRICSLLEKEGIKIKKELAYKHTVLYFVEQFDEAMESRDFQKTALLLRKLGDFLRKNRQILASSDWDFDYERASIQSVRDNELLSGGHELRLKTWVVFYTR